MSGENIMRKLFLGEIRDQGSEIRDREEGIREQIFRIFYNS